MTVRSLWGGARFGALPLVALFALPVQAQGSTEAPAASIGLDAIVVTAQKRAENMQTVPVSVTAVTSEAVENLRAVTLQGLQGTVPNVQINNFSNAPNSAVYTIRGIGVIESDPYAGNTVSIMVDGVPEYFSMGALVDLYDINRIEILRGPQGTLFGANTTGGVVNIITNQPTGEFGGKAEIGYGTYDRLDVSGTVEAPLVEGKLSGKIGISHNERDGYVTNIVDGSDMGRRNVTLFRAALRATPNDRVDATLMGEYVRARNGAPIVVNGATPGEARYVAPGTRFDNAKLPMYANPCPADGGRCKAPDKYYSALEGVPDKSNMNTYRVNFTLNVSDTAIGDITAITGYKKFDLFEYTDQNGTPVSRDDTRRETEGWQLSQELRTAFDVNDSINVILGGFYMKTHYDHQQDFRISFSPPPGLLQVNNQDQDNWSASLFAQSYVDVTDKLRFQAGIRYTHEKTEMVAGTYNSAHPSGVTTFDGTGNTPLGGFTVAGKKSWDNVGWKLGLDYQALDDVMLYGYWARGFKSGGFVGRVGIPQDIGPYDPEKVDTFEAGVKADLLDRRLRVNLAGFYTSYRNMQIAQIYFTEDGSGTTVQGNSILNAGKAEIKGFELEMQALPAEGLTLDGSLAYLDATYDRFLYNQVAGTTVTRVDMAGERLQNAPKWQATLGATYTAQVGPGEARARVLYTYTAAKYLTAINNARRAEVQPTHIVNANLDWTPDSEAWSIGVWATNLFDNRYIQSVYDAPGVFGLVNYAPPREYGVSFKVKW
ncbi:TonB-dependent receptor [Pedomonas sp. V897]|uniref:TonB-dependent receptor n=1 Tax=Pedomonas sp. V897 TaxID=3446482 RepID=UPI003EE39729